MVGVTGRATTNPRAGIPGPTPLNPGDYLRIVSRRWGLIAAVLAGSIILFAVWAYRAAPKYHAEARLHVYQRAPRLVSIEEVVPIDPGRKDYNQTQVEIIRSRKVAGAVFERLRLGESKAFGGHPEPLEAFRQGIIVRPKKETDIIEVAYRGPDREAITEWVNALVDEYLRYNESLRQTTTAGAEQIIRERIPALSKKLEESERAVLAFQQDNNILTFEKEHGMVLDRLRDLELNLTDTQKEVAALASAWSIVEEIRQDGGDLQVLPALRENAPIQKLRVQLQQAREELASAKLRYKDVEGNQLLEPYRTAMVDTQTALDAEVESAIAAIRAEYRQKEEEQRRLEKLVQDHRLTAQTLESKTTRYHELKNESERNRRLYNDFVNRAKEMESSVGMGLDNVTILDRAPVPVQPIWPRKGLLLFLGGIIGLVGGLGAAFLLEFVDDSVQSQEDLDTALGLPLLGHIPRIEGKRADVRARDLVSHLEPKSTISEFFRTIRTGLLYASPDGEIRTLMITSAGPKEGKTTNAINLSITLAAGGSRVLLVDCDLRRARIHKAFGARNDRGLSDILQDGVPIEEAVQATEVENLHLLPSGPLPPNPAELLGTEAMRRFLAEAGGKYDRVILDTPPVVAVTDACVLAGLVDGVVQVVASSKTSRKILQRGKAQLDSTGARMLGVILNNVRVRRAGYGSYGYYYSGYYKYSD